MLRVKLHAPAINKNTVSRDKLLTKLGHAQEYKLTQVTAPAGYGKTTAVLDWLNKCGLPSAWVSLDANDNDTSTFWQYVCASLEHIAEGITKDTEYVFSSEELIKANIHIDILIDRLSQVKSDFLLVLDDLHLIDSFSILTGLSYLIDYLPAKMHLIFISRTPPELRLARHRIKWQIQRLEEEDLRFEAEDIFRFFQARGYTLENDDLNRVQIFTEGWAAALVAVAMSMEDVGFGNDIIAALTRSSWDMAQYLKHEVISVWPHERIAFAMKTSILDTLSEELCDAVTGNKNGRRLLKEIYEKNGFLLDMDGREKTYRYHHLFKSFLQELLEETYSKKIPELNSNAGLWYKQQGLLPEAIEYLLRGGAYNQAFELIEHQIDHLIDKSDFGRLMDWVKRLPAEFRDNSFKIAAIYAAYYAQMDLYDVSRQWVDRMKVLKDNYPYASGPEWSSYSQTVCTMVEANLLVREGKIEFLPMLLSAAENDGGKYYKMPEFYDFNLSDIYFFRCPIYRLTDLFKEAPDNFDRMTESYRGMISKNPGYAPLAIGEYLYECNRLEEALPYLLSALEEALEANCLGALIPAMVDIVRFKRAYGDISGAFAVLEEYEKQLRGIGKTHWLYLLEAFRCKLYLDIGHTDKVQEWCCTGKLNIFTELNKTREFELIVYARTLMSLGQTQDAQILLQRLLAFTGNHKRPHSRVEVLNILALLAFRENHLRLAFKYIDESLEIGLKEGYVRSYIDELAPMAQVLRAYIKSRGKQSQGHLLKERKVFAGGLLKQMPESLLPTLSAQDMVAEGITEKVLEQLTAQERKVLELIVNAATNQEIGDKLGISLWTVKTHTGNIYGKLGLKNRAQCIKLVRDLRLL